MTQRAPDEAAGWRLVLDTATRRTVVAIGRGPRLVLDRSADAGVRRGALVLEQLDEALRSLGIGAADLEAIGVGTGPGSFTGLRIGLATAKTLAWTLGTPIIGLSTFESLARAARTAIGGAVDPFAVVMAAGARDHYLAAEGADAVLVPSGRRLRDALGGRGVIAVEVDRGSLDGVTGPLGADPLELGRTALAGLPDALLLQLDERLAGGGPDDAMTLVPGYVAMPRGVAILIDPAWSPELR